MAGRLISATYKLNERNPVALTVTDYAVDQTIDFSGQLKSGTQDRAAFLLNRIAIKSIDEEGAESSDRVTYLAYSLHKQLFATPTPGATGIQVDNTTTINNMFGQNSPIEIKAWMPYESNGSAWVARELNAAQVEDLMENIHFGLMLEYVDNGTGKVKFAPILHPSTYVVSTSTSARSQLEYAVGSTVSITTANAKSFSGALRFDGANGLLATFGMTVSDIDANTQITLSLISYCGAEMASHTTATPNNWSYIYKDGTTNGAKYQKTNPRIGSVNNIYVSVFNADATYNNEIYDADDIGWVAEYDSNGTLDTSISIMMSS